MSDPNPTTAATTAATTTTTTVSTAPSGAARDQVVASHAYRRTETGVRAYRHNLTHIRPGYYENLAYARRTGTLELPDYHVPGGEPQPRSPYQPGYVPPYVYDPTPYYVPPPRPEYSMPQPATPEHMEWSREPPPPGTEEIPQRPPWAPVPRPAPPPPPAPTPRPPHPGARPPAPPPVFPRPPPPPPVPQPTTIGAPTVGAPGAQPPQAQPPQAQPPQAQPPQAQPPQAQPPQAQPPQAQPPQAQPPHAQRPQAEGPTTMEPAEVRPDIAAAAPSAADKAPDVVPAHDFQTDQADPLVIPIRAQRPVEAEDPPADVPPPDDPPLPEPPADDPPADVAPADALADAPKDDGAPSGAKTAESENFVYNDESSVNILDQRLIEYLETAERDDPDDHKDATFFPSMVNVAEGSSSASSSVSTAVDPDEAVQLEGDAMRPVQAITARNVSDKSDTEDDEEEEQEEEPEVLAEGHLRINFDDPEVRAEQREFARKLAAKEAVATTSKPPEEDWLQTQALLYKRANLEIPTKHRKAKPEYTVENLDFESMDDKKYRDSVGGCVKLAAGAAMLAVRLVKDLRDEFRLIGHSVKGLQDQVATVRRVVSRNDVAPPTGKEVSYNPRLNPLLAGFIPLDTQEAVIEFLDVPDRIIALQRFIADNVKWNPSNFARKMVRMVVTLQYRYDYNYPAAKIYPNEVYIPEQLKDFFTGTASFVADKAGYIANLNDINEQLRRLFQKSTVTKEMERRGEKAIAPEKRQKPFSGFPPSDEEDVEPSSPKKKAPKRKSARLARKDDAKSSESETEGEGESPPTKKRKAPAEKTDKPQQRTRIQTRSQAKATRPTEGDEHDDDEQEHLREASSDASEYVELSSD